MVIIIDGYNMIKSTLRISHISDNQRKSFIEKIKRYAKITKNKIILVFDGGQVSWPWVSTEKFITVVYSGQRYTADDWIKNYIDDNKDLEVVLVSSDNELCSYAHNASKVTIDSLDFYSFLQKTIKSKKSLSYKKPVVADQVQKFDQSDSNPELDALMMESVVFDKSEESKKADLSSKNSHKLSKWEKKLLKLVKKL